MNASRSPATTDRRSFLRTLGLAAAAAGVAGCAPGRSLWTPEPRRTFGRVRVSWSRVIRTVAGLRPYRPSGFVVRAEALDDTVVVHNYGHGGGGVTLSWGTAELAAEAVAETEDREVAVLGSGVAGLTTARILQRRGRTVTIYARDLPPDTTSNVAGAQWAPYSVFDEASPRFRSRFRRATRLAYRRYQDFVGRGYGVDWVDNYYVGQGPADLPAFMREMDDVFPDVEEVPAGAHPFGDRSATRVRTMFVEPHRFLPALMADVRRAGGRIVVRELQDRREVAGLPERVVVNCTGLGSRELFGDDELVPVKGQLTVLAPQPEVDYLLLGGDGLYMFPRSDGILLGGTFQRGEWSLEPDPDETERIVRGHMRLFGFG